MPAPPNPRLAGIRLAAALAVQRGRMAGQPEDVIRAEAVREAAAAVEEVTDDLRQQETFLRLAEAEIDAAIAASRVPRR